MFFSKKKLDQNLRISLINNCYRKYKVIIQCRYMPEGIEKKIKSYHGKIVYSLYIINCIIAILSKDAIEKLIEYPDIVYIGLDNYAILAGSNVTSVNGIFHNNTEIKLNGKNIGIGIIDSGVYPHPDLLNPNNKIKKFIDLINGFTHPYDDNGHGTFITGILCGSGYISHGKYSGIAEGSNIYMVKAFNSLGKGYVSDILNALCLIIKERIDFNIKILCLTFELPYNNYFIMSLFEKIFEIAVKYNIIPIVPSGNNGGYDGSISGIAPLENCLTVGGIDTTGFSPKIYEYSSCGPVKKIIKPDLVAAAVNIYSLNSDVKYISERNGLKIYPPKLKNPYTCYSGTSCAAAYISGVCALLLEKKPDLSFNDIESLIKISCNTINLPKYKQGTGVLDINKLLTN